MDARRTSMVARDDDVDVDDMEASTWLLPEHGRLDYRRKHKHKHTPHS